MSTKKIITIKSMCYFGILSLRKISLRIDKFEGKGLENKYIRK